MRCPHCGAPGEVVGQTPDILPKSVQCGGCRESFPYIGTALERIFADATTDKDKPFYFRPFQRAKSVPSKEEVPIGDPRFDRLHMMSTRELLDLLHRHRGPQVYHKDSDIISMGHGGPVFTAGEIKAVLATRPHIPSKQESRRARTKAAQNRKGGKGDR